MSILEVAKDIARAAHGSKRSDVTWYEDLGDYEGGEGEPAYALGEIEWTLEYRVYPRIEASFYEPGHSGIEGFSLLRDGIPVDPSEYEDEWRRGLRRAVEQETRG